MGLSQWNHRDALRGLRSRDQQRTSCQGRPTYSLVGPVDMPEVSLPAATTQNLGICTVSNCGEKPVYLLVGPGCWALHGWHYKWKAGWDSGLTGWHQPERAFSPGVVASAWQGGLHCRGSAAHRVSHSHMPLHSQGRAKWIAHETWYRGPHHFGLDDTSAGPLNVLSKLLRRVMCWFVESISENTPLITNLNYFNGSAP